MATPQSFADLLSETAPRLRAAPGDDACIASTAGSTGEPVAHRVALTVLEARARAVASALRLGPADRIHISLPPTDLLGAVPLLAARLMGGASTEAGSATVEVTTPAGLWPLLRRIGGRRTALRLARRFPGLRQRLFRDERGPLTRVAVTGSPLPSADRELLNTAGIAVEAFYGLVEAGGPVAHDPDGLGFRPLGDAALAIMNAGPDGHGELTVDGIPTGDRARALGGGRFEITGRLATAISRDGAAVQAELLEHIYGRHPLIADLAVTKHEGAPVALVRPDLDAIRASATSRIDDAMRIALAELAVGQPREHALAGHAVLRTPLAHNRRGEPARAGLEVRYAAVLSGEGDVSAELSPADAALLGDPTAAKVWSWLRGRYPGRSLTLDHSLQLDLAIDSLEWVTFALELEQVAGVPLDEEVMSRAATLRDLLAEAVERQGRPVPERHAASGEPTELDAAQREWIAPLRWYHRLMGAVAYYVLLGPLIRWPFRLKVEGIEHLPKTGGVLIIANHLSDLDPPVVGAALPYRFMQHSYWSGEATRLFTTPLLRFLARSFRVFPTQERVASTSLAYAKAVLDRGDRLTWFPESWRSPDGRLQRFMPGVGRIVASSDVAIVPARIVGTFEAMPRGASWPRLHPVTIRFAPPIRSAEVIARAGPDATHARIAAVLHDELAKLPGEPAADAVLAPPRRQAASGTPVQHLMWALQAIPIWLVYGLLRIMTLDAASGFGAGIARRIGPKLKLSNRARHNLRRCWPDMQPADVEIVVADMWDNLGRLAGEIVHLDGLQLDSRQRDGRTPRIEVVGQEHIDAVKASSRPALFFSGHLANWELSARVAALNDLPITLVYRSANNPWAEKLIQHARGAGKMDLVPKGVEAAQRIVEAMRSGGRIGLVADQKTNNGIPAPFFGRPAMTTPVLAMCAMAYDCPIYPVQVERLKGASFRVTVHPPLDVARTGDEAADRTAITAAVNAVIESWVRLRPAQWMWLHRRWPD